jgi:uncharacterized caspase-like protein
MKPKPKGESNPGQGDPQSPKTGMGVKTPMNAYALLIGVGQSKYSDWSLPVTVRDVGALQETLIDRDLCAYPAERVRVLTDEAATRDGILEAVDDLAQAAAKDSSATFLVYYSGHGWQEVGADGERYFLLPHDVRPHELTESALPADDFIRGLQSIRSERLLVMIDTCHAEAMADAKNVVVSLIPKGFAQEPLPEALTGKLETGKGRAVFLSCGKEEKSWILPGEKSLSIFTHHLLAALRGAGNSPEDDTVKVSHLMTYLSREVQKSASGMGEVQTPVFKFKAGDFSVALIQGGKDLRVKSAEEPSGNETSDSVLFKTGKITSGRDSYNIGRISGGFRTGDS